MQILTKNIPIPTAPRSAQSDRSASVAGLLPLSMSRVLAVAICAVALCGVPLCSGAG